MRNLIFLILLFTLVFKAYSSEIDIDGFGYNLLEDQHTATIIYAPEDIIDLEIPENIEYEGTNYTVTSIGNKAFTNCYMLTNAIIGNSIKFIGEQAFSYCTELTSITIGNAVEFIGKYAFSNCSGLRGVYISDLAKWCQIKFENEYSNPGSSLYVNNELITELIIPDMVTSISDYAFFYYKQLTSVTLGSSVESIGYQSFYHCENLTSIEIPESVTTIGSSAFAACYRLRKIYIGSSVTEIGARAFSYCNQVEKVRCYAEIPPTCNVNFGANAFTETNQSNITLQVPVGTKEAYENSYCWKNFNEIVDNLPVIDVESILLNYTNIEINVGESIQLEATVLPENATEKTVTWHSSASWNVSVSETGLITGVYSGEATITATCGDFSATCEVTVVVAAEEVTLNNSVIDLYIGDTYQLNAYIYPYNTTDKTIVWLSSHPEIASVTDDGVVTALAEGSTTITASCGDASATCDVTVSRFTVAPTISPEPDNFTYKLPDISIYWGEYDFNIVTPATTNPSLTYGDIEIDLADYCSRSVVTSSVSGPWGSWTSTAYVLNISLSKLTLTAPGDYQLIVPQGYVYLIGADIYNDEITQVFSVRASNDSYFTSSFTVEPPINSQLTSLDKLTLTYINYPLYENEINPEYISIYKDNEPMELGENDTTIISNDNGSGIVELNLPSLQGVLGKLDIKIAEGALLSKEGKINKAINLSYTVALEDTGIESLFTDPSNKVSVYSLDGILIIKDCSSDDLKSLNKGIYIVVSGKEKYKIVVK